MLDSASQCNLRFGLGLRSKYYESLLSDRLGCVDWLEAVTENYLGVGGQPRHFLARLREHYTIVLHGVSLSIGGADPLDRDYLQQLRSLADWLDTPWISDHLCWTGVDRINLHDLLPLPYTEAVLDHVATRINVVQDTVQRPFVLENVSSYVAFNESQLSECEFLAQLVERTNCGLLLDVNNVYVSSVNHGFDAREYLHALPLGSVRQIHLAGHTRQGRYLVDTHDAPVTDAVWDLYREAIARFGPVPSMIERDDRFPPLEELLSELDRARQISADEQRKAA